MPYCFAFGCNSGGRTKVAVPLRFFRPPKDLKLFELWKLKIPRKDKELTASASLCPVALELRLAPRSGYST